MRRRSFFGAVAAGVVGALFPSLATGDEPPPLNPVFRFNYATDSWARCRMYELRNGDVFRLGDVGTFRAVGDPVREPNGRWSIISDVALDPETGEWVDANAV